MEHYDALIVGGGPAGSTCAWRLRHAGLDVAVMDSSSFPRDKVCAGWITTQVVDDLRLDIDEYRVSRTFQPITGFRTGVIGGDREVETNYEHPVSFGIRRCEFDDYLLKRSRARLNLGVPFSSVRREGRDWIVNDRIRTPLLVGAGGHFCPVARHLNGPLATDETALVVAQEVEFPVDPRDGSFTTDPQKPELYFSRDLRGYGWCFRKQDHLNVGFGHLSRRALPKATEAFVAFLVARKKVPKESTWRWRGHAYLLHASRRRTFADGVMLVGDAAGLAYPQSGEGIRPAVESGLLAASSILRANGLYAADRLASYQHMLSKRFGTGQPSPPLAGLVPANLVAGLARRLLRIPTFVRHVVLDRWFLHSHDPALESELECGVACSR
jgi:geranylgeranyl reductase family protein